MKPILIDLPMPILTQRLLIRPAMPGDGAAANPAILETFENLKPWIPWATHMPSLEETEEKMRTTYAQWILRENMSMNVFDRATGEFIGGTGYHRPKWAVPQLEIGVWIRKSREGQGLVQEAVTALLQYAFVQLGAKRIEYCCDPENLRSIAVATKLGFKREAHLVGNYTRPGTLEIRDTLIFARFSAENLPDVGATWT